MLIVFDISDEALEAAEADWTPMVHNLSWDAVRFRTAVVTESNDG